MEGQPQARARVGQSPLGSVSRDVDVVALLETLGERGDECLRAAGFRQGHEDEEARTLAHMVYARISATVTPDRRPVFRHASSGTRRAGRVAPR